MARRKGGAATIDDVAARCGVSIATVSKALSLRPVAGEVSAATVGRVRAAAAALGYVPDWRVRRLASARSRTIGLVYAQAAPLVGGIYQDLLPALAEAVTGLGYRLVLAPAADGVASWRQVMRQFRLDGCLACEPLPLDAANWSASDNLPVVAVNMEAGQSLSRVVCDDAGQARLAVAHLRGLGHHDIAYLGPGRGTHASIEERRNGFAAAAGPGARCVRTAGSDGDADGDAVRRVFADGWPRAVVAYNHHLARAVIHACAADRRGIPQELSLVSCDDVRALAYPVPPVTAVRVPVRGMAGRAARLLVDCIEGRERPSGQRIVVDGELQVRGSTAPPATSSSVPARGRRPRRA